MTLVPAVPEGAFDVVPDGACIFQHEGKGMPQEDAVWHVSTFINDSPEGAFCGRKGYDGKPLGGEDDAYSGRQRLCKDCVRVVKARVKPGEFFRREEGDD